MRTTRLGKPPSPQLTTPDLPPLTALVPIVWGSGLCEAADPLRLSFDIPRAALPGVAQ